jgi:hypothetical protein
MEAYDSASGWTKQPPTDPVLKTISTVYVQRPAISVKNSDEKNEQREGQGQVMKAKSESHYIGTSPTLNFPNLGR